MQELVEFVNANKLLMTGFIASGLAVLFYELRLKARNIASLSIPQAVRVINDGGIVYDVRSPAEFAGQHIIDARNVPQAELLKDPSVLKKSKKNALLVCGNGDRSGECVARLRRDGLENVFSLRGGLAEWAKENLPLVSEKAAGEKTPAAKK